MTALPGTLTSYKYRDVPFAIWLDQERAVWCVDTREVGRVYPEAQGKIICNLPNAAQAVLVGKQLIEDIWRASRMLPALPERFHGQRFLPPAPRKPIQLPPAPVEHPPIALPAAPERRYTPSERWYEERRKRAARRLERFKPAIADLARRGPFTTITFAQAIGRSRREASSTIAQLMSQGYLERAVIEDPVNKRLRQIIGELATQGGFTAIDLAGRLGVPYGSFKAPMKRILEQGLVRISVPRLRVGPGSTPIVYALTDEGRRWIAGEIFWDAHLRARSSAYARDWAFQLTPEGWRWVEGVQENPIESRTHPAALAAIILGVGLLATGIASKFLRDPLFPPSHAASQLGQAVLQDAQSDVGVMETSLNSGPRVDQMLANVGVNVPANWCAAAVSTWIFEGASMLSVTRPIQGSASVVALMNQFQDASNPRVGFLNASFLRAHPEAVTPGMIMILNRGGTGSGLGHTGIVEKNLGGGMYATIEGNSGPGSNSVVRNQRNLSAEAFIGMGVLKDVAGYNQPNVGVGYMNDPPDAPIFATVGVSGPPLETVSLVFPSTGLEIEAELARTPAERTEGLSHRSSLPRDHGMLFVFDSSGNHGFWMHETYIPLDVLFLDEAFNIVGIVENMQPGDLTLRRIGRPSRYALEVNAGFARAYGIQVGQRVVEVATPLS